MKNVGKNKDSQRNFYFSVFLGIMFIACMQASAGETNYWIGTSSDGSWGDASNWSLGHTPAGGDSVMVTQYGNTDITVNYVNTLDGSSYSVLQVDATGKGTITLSLSSDDDNLSADFEYIGVNGAGEVTQIDGTNVVSQYLFLGKNSGSTGAYNLSGGDLSAVNEYVGFGGTGTFTQTRGTNSATKGISVGSSSGGISTYELSGTGYITTASEIISTNGKFEQTGGTNQVTSLALLGTYSSFYELSGDESLLSADSETIGYTGTCAFTQTGGTNKVTSILAVGGGSSLGTKGVGSYIQTGGDTIIEDSTWGLTLGHTVHSIGTYELSSNGNLSAAIEHIGRKGDGTFTQTGGTNTVSDKLIIAEYTESTGTYNLQGGSLTAGSIENNDTFNYSGGTLTAGTITNNGTMTLSGTGTRTVTGDVTNYGTVKVTDTTADFNGTFENYGAYISDPSASYFDDLIIGSTGYLTGGDGDSFYISGDFSSI